MFRLRMQVVKVLELSSGTIAKKSHNYSFIDYGSHFLKATPNLLL
jgi:hypothetical protein